MAPTAPEDLARSACGHMALRGPGVVAFGVIALTRPGATALALVIVLAAWAFMDGIFAFWSAAHRGRVGMSWGWFAFEGIASIAVGIAALAYPGLTMLALIILVAIRAIALGVLEIGGAFAWRGLESRWLYGLAGLVSLVFGGLLLWQPLVGGLALVWTIGVYAIVIGVMVFVAGLRIHGLQQQGTFTTRTPHAAAM